MVAKPKGNREQHWSDVTSEPATAYRAQWGLADSEGLAQFLRTKIGARVPLSEGNRIAQLIVDLDDKSFRIREAASAELIRLGRVAEPSLRNALTKSPSAEQRERLDNIVARYDQGISLEDLRLRRSIQALTWSHDPDAKKLLLERASGMPGAPLTELAKTALNTLK